jgi:hypoxanthine phosphoribosyltransferase
MKEISWQQFTDRLNSIQFKSYDHIVAIGRGGIIPAAFIQHKLSLPMSILYIKYRDDSHMPMYEDAVLHNQLDLKGKRILLVDDVSRTGKTLKQAKEHLADNEMTTFLINGKADLSMFDSVECLKMPWH